MLGDQGADVIVIEQPHTPDIIRDSGPARPRLRGCQRAVRLDEPQQAVDLAEPQDRGRPAHPEGSRAGGGRPRPELPARGPRPPRPGLGDDVGPQPRAGHVLGLGLRRRRALLAPPRVRPHHPVGRRLPDGAVRRATACPTSCPPPCATSSRPCTSRSRSAPRSVARANGAGGQHIELAMVDASIHFLWPETMWHYTYLDFESDMPNVTDIYKLYQTSDGWAMVYPVALESHWRSMCNALGPARPGRRSPLRRPAGPGPLRQRHQRRAAGRDQALHDRRAGRADGPAPTSRPRRSTPARAMIDDPHVQPPGHGGRDRPPHRRPHPPGPAAGAVLQDALLAAPPRPLLRGAHRRGPGRGARSERIATSRRCTPSGAVR